MPLIKVSDLLDVHGMPKLNSWFFKGKTYRVIGYDIEKDTHQIKCNETGRVQEKSTDSIRRICSS